MDAAAASSAPASSPPPAEFSGGVERTTTHTQSGAPQVGAPTATGYAYASSAAADHGADGDKPSSPHPHYEMEMARDTITQSLCFKFDKEKPDQEVTHKPSGSVLICPGNNTDECSQNSFRKMESTSSFFVAYDDKCEEETAETAAFESADVSIQCAKDYAKVQGEGLVTHTVSNEKAEEILINDPLPPLVRADSDVRPTFQESSCADRSCEKQPTESDEDKDLYLHRIRLREVLDEKDYLVRELEYAKKQLDEVKSVNSEIHRENRKLKKCLRTNAVEAGISKKVLEKLAYCHDIFSCPSEVGVQKLEEHLSRSECKLLYTVKIPGATTDPAWKILEKMDKMTPLCKVVFLGMVEDVYRLHRVGLCLSGKFSLKDFCWTLDQKVKLRAKLKRYVSRRKLKRMRLDYRKLREVMIDMLKDCKVNIPADLEYLLDLMRDDPVKHQFLIRYNFCFMDDILKREDTFTLFTQYEQLNREDREKHGNDTEKYRTAIAVSFITLPDNVGSAMSANKFTKQIYDRWRGDTGIEQLNTKRKLIEVIRHGIVHLPEKAFDEEKKTHYTDANVVDMLQVISPQVFSQFQRGMYEIKKLAYPHLIRVMKT
uniref:Uncharacterized protein n=1 Tax=Oryza punctata TaxID=4537 RepID=A0A0E0LIE9_ORYPU